MKILDSGRNTAAANMALDERLLQNLEHDPEPLIHLYDWEGEAATYGRFMDPDLLLKPGHGLQLAKRPTGGGLIFHTSDLAFSLLIPASHPFYSTNTLANYRTINERVAKAIEAFTKGRVVPALFSEEQAASRPTFCMAAPTIYDLIVEGKKVAGAAQRRTKHGLLHQGTICLTLPTHLGYLRDPLLADAIQKNSYCLQGNGIELKRRLIEAFQ